MKTIDGFPDYKVTRSGKVFSLKSNKFLRQERSKFGYLRVTLFLNGNRNKKFVHRLVAGAYIDNSKKKPHINHKNGVKTDNSVSNLEWVTPLENMGHARAVLGRRPISQKLNKEDIECIRFFAEPKKRNGSRNILAKIFGVNRKTISSIACRTGIYK